MSRLWGLPLNKELMVWRRDRMGIPVEFSQNWWMGLTKPDCMTIFEETEGTQAQISDVTES